VDKARVLIVADDEWMSTLLRRNLENASFEVHLAVQAQQGLEQAIDLEPDCIICDEDLPDVDGYWLVERLRREPTRVNATPVLLLTEQLEALQGVSVGADLLLNKPLNHDEVVTQVGALIDMARRLRQRDSSSPQSTEGRAALRGDIAQMSVTTLMTVLEMERRTGKLVVEASSQRRAFFMLHEGALWETRLNVDATTPIELLREVLRWKLGRFAFQPGEQTPPAATPRHAVGALLLEAARLEDEAGM
jgi:DNA-binding response OmpR family regulator